MSEPSHIPVDTATATPPKSILKKRDSHDCDSHRASLDETTNSCNEHSNSKGRGAQWDEMNILATYHPEGKEYGHMKIDDPPTPYHEYAEEPDDEGMEGTDPSKLPRGSLRERKTSFSDNVPGVLDSDALAKKLAAPYEPKTSRSQSSESDEDSFATEEEKAKKKEFSNKRKQHYNEFQVSTVCHLF